MIGCMHNGLILHWACKLGVLAMRNGTQHGKSADIHVTDKDCL